MSEKGNSRLEGEGLSLFLLRVFLIVFLFTGLVDSFDDGEDGVSGAIIFGASLISYTLTFIHNKDQNV